MRQPCVVELVAAHGELALARIGRGRIVDERLALARALTWTTPVFVADLVLEQLASDSNAAVRAASLAAVARHFHEDSAAYANIVSKCLDDADGNVQKLARALMKRAQA